MRQSPLFDRFSFFLLNITRPGRLAGIISKYRELCVSHSPRRIQGYYYYSFESFSHNSKSPRVSKTPHSILADLNKAIVWMVSTHLLISKSSTPYINPLVTVPRATITIGIIYLHMYVYIYAYIYIYTHRYIYIYIYIYVKRDREIAFFLLPQKRLHKTSS